MENEMSELNKALLRKANAAIRAGDNEGFLAFCSQDIQWSVVGGGTLHGIEAVREMMARDYVEPPSFTEDQMIAEGEFLAVLGNITTKDGDGPAVLNAYCDVWRIKGGKLAELKAWVIPQVK